MTVNIDFDFLIRRILERELERPENYWFLPEEDLKEMLDDREADTEVRSGICGYPTRPLYKDLSKKFQECLSTRHCPTLTLPKYDLLDESAYEETRKEMCKSLEEKLDRFECLYNDWSEDERFYYLRDILVLLGKRGILDVLGLRKTVGSKDFWPPSRAKLEESFFKLCNPGTSSLLTVGARALSKHSHRDTSSIWWGNCMGSEAAKNSMACDKLKTILDGATWVNIHGLPHDITTIEARQENGYGVRWTIEDMEFRGFLEPTMEEGHEKGWKH